VQDTDANTAGTDAFLGALDVGIDLPLATPASRSLAYFIDLLLLWLIGAILLAGAVLAGGNLMDLGVEPGPLIAAVVIAWVSFEGAWFTGWEWLAQGRTPGKRAMGLRVVRSDGRAVGLGGALIRNLLRPLDLGTSGVVALVVAGLTRRHQRLGDLAGGTLVVHDHAAPPPRAQPTRWPDGIADADVGLLEAWFDRAPAMAPEPREALALRMAAHVGARHPGFVEPGPPETAGARLSAAFGVREG
jgi:uncharacterized RDD family membrane protein YckC